MKAVVGDGLKTENANWTFGGDVAHSFDDHVSKSVPLYNEGHQLGCYLSDFFIENGSLCYEIGSSTGEQTIKLAQHNAHKPQARFIGIEVESGMVAKANEKKKELGLESVEFICDDALQFPFQQADMIVAYYTIQFIRPAQRQKMFDIIYQNLKWGGAFLLFEKVRAPDARFQDIMTNIYNDYKLAQGYSPEEIFGKTRSLKGVLEPFSTQGNLDLMKRAGFTDIMTVMKYVSFEGFLAIK